MKINLHIYKYHIILTLLFFVYINKTTAQNNINNAKNGSLTFAGSVLISSFEWNKDKSVSYPGVLNMDNGNTKNKKTGNTVADTVKTKPVPSTLRSDILHFSSTVSNNNAILQWKASNLQDAREFIVEQSLDGSSYKEVSVIDAEEKINGIIVSQEDGLSYYRLKVLDKNGNTAYTEPLVCHVNTKASGIVSVFPNSISDEWLTALSVVTDYRGKIKVVITDDHGRQLIEFHREIITEKSRIPIGVATIPKGSYYIFVSMKDGAHIGTALELVKN
jgi:hypothetical protein